MGRFDSSGQCLGDLQERRDARLGGKADRRPVGRLHGDGPRDAERLAGPERQEEAARLEVGTPDRFDHAQPRDGRPAEIDPREVHRGDPGLVALAESQASQAEDGPVPGQREQGVPGGVGHAHLHRAEEGTQEGQSVVEVSADQELGRGQALQLQRLGGGRGYGGREIGLGGLGAPAGVRQCVAQLLPEVAERGPRSGMELQCDPVQFCRMVERERRRRLVGPADVVIAGERGLAGTPIMTGQDLRVGRAGGR